ncbi:DUF6221 family protein [Streptomyces sp. MPA0124]|uniref:DUF6221 family protein n=1 Tax=Streptomyces sp. MPA0124 TaxID=3378069 RepID=UPI0038555AA0
MSDIADFLRARYAEQRALALAASPGPWHSDGGSVYATHPTDEVVNYTESADHIAAHDPSAVLADLDAKLAIVDLMERTLSAAEGDSEVDHYGGLGVAEETLCRLAQPFAGHPDHKGEKWAP